MTDSRSHRRRWRRIVVLAVLGLLAGTAWLLPARLGSPSPAVQVRAGRQTGHMAATPTHLARQQPTTPRSTRHHVARAASPQPRSPGPGIPVRLRIPALGLMTAIEPVGLRAGAMDVPANVWHVGWFHLGPRPGDVGNAVIDGHLDSTTGPAIFLNLQNLRIGDRIYVTDRAGIERGFVVTALHSYLLTEAPRARIFGPTTERHLNLITCSGTWQARAHQYDQRLVVYTRLLG
jgi:sortase (surface protein transpeptidase)